MSKRMVMPVLGLVGFMAVGFTAQTAVRADDDDKKTPDPVQIRMRDFCDQRTFDLVAGPGTCIPIIGSGVPGMPFGFFFGELLQDKSVGEWRFNPDRIEVEEGTKLILTNLGGETHTLTKVEKFGGGFVAPLNGPSGTPVPAPECAQVLPDGSLAPQPESPDNQFVEALTTEQGPTIKGDEGTIRFQCCIHPWMRLVVKHKEH